MCPSTPNCPISHRGSSVRQLVLRAQVVGANQLLASAASCSTGASATAVEYMYVVLFRHKSVRARKGKLRERVEGCDAPGPWGSGGGGCRGARSGTAGALLIGARRGGPRKGVDGYGLH